MKATVLLTEEEVKLIVLEHLTKKFKVVNSVKVKVGNEYHGVGAAESKRPTFQGIECEIEIE